MLKIRLQRLGRRGRPNYRVVLAEHSAPIQGKYITSFGHYDPLSAQNTFEVDVDKIFEWIKKGAQPTNTVARLLKGSGVKGMEGFIVEMKNRKVKNPKEEEVKAPAADAGEATADAPTEEKVEEKKEEKAEEKEEKAEEKKEEEKEEGSTEDKKEEKAEEATEEKSEDADAETESPAEEEAKKDEEKAA